MKKPNPSIDPKRVTTLREALNLSQQELAEQIGATQQSIDMIERGKVRRPTKLHELAKALNADTEYLLNQQDVPRRDGARAPAPDKRDFPTTEIVRVPDLAIFGGMGGGGALEVYVDDDGEPTDDEQVRGFWTFPEYVVRGLGSLKHIYAWEVRGDSMEPTLHGGAVVFVDTRQNCPPPDDLYAINYGDGLMVKRLKLVPRTDRISVISDNERYGADDLLRDDVKIWGRVVGWFQWRG